ncbi:MAG: hypothetical protein DI626_05265 [Micavibrio aeruginosavorus]|uniref:Uncharacterized protein n=1 Tax=Micavibrio aeruginosavorus TaxID=349221 RepID=A0A2W5A3C9_9BACT|nr:MAG: hypothetical protein DI626_05265 [Micavibrio aeruginosavorus]
MTAARLTSTETAGFYGAVAAGVFSILMIGWKGIEGASADWVYGFLAVFWSLLMMLRLITLTDQGPLPAGNHLAQQIIGSMYKSRDAVRRALLQTSLGGSFALFVGVCFVFAGWMAFQMVWDNANAAPFTMAEQFLRQSLGAQSVPVLSAMSVTLFDLGHFIMAMMTLSMMGFVLRSHGLKTAYVRPAMIIAASYATAGLIVFSGLEASAQSFFDEVVQHTGAVGAGILALMLFVPLGYISLTASLDDSDWMIVACAMITGSALICAVFLPFTPLLAAYMALCWMGVFLAWGACERVPLDNSIE